VRFSPEADRDSLASRLGEYDAFAPELAEDDSGCYLLPIDQLADVETLADSLLADFGAVVAVQYPRASVSAVGFDVGKDAAVERFALEALTARDISVHDSMRFEHAVTCIVDASAVEQAAQAFHEGFRINDSEVADVA